jgi:hypothetical protein
MFKMKKHTLIENIKLDPHTYLITIGTEIGQFTGTAVCREEDWDRESQYFGFELAEIKAEIAYARAKRNRYEAQLKALTEFWRDMMTTRNYDQNAFWVKKMRLKVDGIESQMQFWADRVKYLKETYHLKIVTFDSLKSARNRYEEKRV